MNVVVPPQVHPPAEAGDLTPLLEAKDHAAPSVFRPENLLRESRRQKGLAARSVPEICVLDPDGDVIRQLRAEGRAQPFADWACYHTELHVAEHDGQRFGIVGYAVGAPFAVLVAEQLFVSGCALLISITSAGQIVPAGPTPYFVLIDRAMRDEGTSHHYLPPTRFADADPLLVEAMMHALGGGTLAVRRGATWTTDAPYRETETAIEDARSHGVLAVEMEAAALYAFARARGRPVVCFAQITNQMAQVHGDFEKGAANGAHDALDLIARTARGWRELG